ncbi:hypothetical protein T484DRAFT_1890830 [Baffinella frigidus]|nr:hypothetical protein T484DRAFT_1890830 [Cryptophyta sp. CCMP2293]
MAEGRKLWSMPPRDAHNEAVAKPRYSTSARSPSPAPFASDFNLNPPMPAGKASPGRDRWRGARTGSPNVSVGGVSYGTAGTPPTRERERSGSAGYSRGRSSIGLGHEVASLDKPGRPEWAQDHPHAPSQPAKQPARRTEQQERRDRIGGALAAFTTASPVKAAFPTALKRCPRPPLPRSSAGGAGSADGGDAGGRVSLGAGWDRAPATARSQRGPALHLDKDTPAANKRTAGAASERAPPGDRALGRGETPASSLPTDARLLPGGAGGGGGVAGGWARVLLAVWLSGCAGWWGRGLAGAVARVARGGGGGGWAEARRRGAGRGGAAALAAAWGET